MAEYIGILKTKFEELAALNPLTIDLKKLQEKVELDKVYHCLAGLDPSYETVQSQIMLSNDQPSFSSIVALLQREETRCLLMNQTPHLAKPENSSFFTKTAGFKGQAYNPNTNQRGRGEQATDICTHCKNSGHNCDGC
jgi:hypothetical protein